MPQQLARVILLLSAAWLQPAAAFGQDREELGDSPPENPPRILVAATIDDYDHLVLVTYRTIYIGFEGECYNHRSLSRLPLEGVRIRTVGGDELSLESARKRIAGRDTPILATPYDKPPADFYAKMFAPETLLFVFPKKAPAWNEIQSPGTPVKQ